MRPRLGAHMSVAGGLPRAVERAIAHRCEAFQIFAKNANQWRGRDVPVAEVREFRARVAAAGLSPVVSHASYLINLRADTVVVTGCTTSGCVRGSVVDAFAYNFRVAVPNDAVYDRSAASHAVNLFDMSEKYADVMTTEECAQKLRAINS